MSMLPETMQRSSEGHLSEVALSTLADGQHAALSAATHAHLDDCEACRAQLADLLLEHALAGEAVLALRDRLTTETKTPWGWIALAALCMLGLRGAELVDLVARHGVVRHVKHAKRASALVVRSLLDQSSWTVGLCGVAAAAVLVVALSKWVAPPRERA